MTDATPPVQPIAPPAASYAPPVVAKKRPVWPWLVGGGVLLFVLIVGVIVAVIVFTIVHQANEKSAVQATVLTFDQAFRDADCDEFESVTTDDVRDAVLGSNYNCDDFEELADSFTVDGEYDYAVHVLRSSVSGDSATVHTAEGTGDGDSGDYEYTLQLKHGDWVITNFEED
jgi:hypothetical protein